MKDGNSFRKNLLFLLLSAAVVCAGIFFFHTTEKPIRSTNITITPDAEDIPTEFTQPSAARTTLKVKTTASKTKTTVHTSHSEAIPTTSEFVCLDINSASADELTKLKGIGEVLAQEIISYRESSGGFRNIEEIMNVKGIGEGIFNDIRDHIYVTDPVYDKPEEFSTSEDTPEDVQQETEEHAPTLEELSPIKINTAERDVLLLLPHVDEDIADRIIDFRERAGGFKSEYELLLIDGLSRSEVSEIMDHITVEN